MRLLEVQSVSKRFGGLTANQDVSFSLERGQIVGLIGPNGAGKTTLFNCVAGFFAPSAGTVKLDGQTISGLPPEACCRAGVGRTFQIARTFTSMTVSEQRRLAVARALATSPKLLLMDEVMAGLNPSEVRETVDVVLKIRDLGLACLIVEHVLEGSMPIADKIVVLDRGSKIAEGTPAEVSNDPAVIHAYLGDE